MDSATLTLGFGSHSAVAGTAYELFMYSSVFGDKSTSEGIVILHLEICLPYFNR